MQSVGYAFSELLCSGQTVGTDEHLAADKLLGFARDLVDPL